MSIIQGVGSGEVSTGFYPHTIDNSLRFNAGDDPFLSRTPSSAGNRRTWTWSAWVKRGDISNTDRELFGTAAEGDVLKFTDSRLMWFNNGSAGSFLSTSAFFRDPGSWYNIVLVFDTTQSTASNRVKLFVNGTAVAFDNNTTFPSLNYDGDINNTEAQFIGKGHGAAEFDGYLAEVILLDGTAVSDASNFGELKNDIWVAKNYSGSYGTNGFRLQFKESGTGTGSSSTVGADTSGNDNHFTSSGITSADQVSDTPTNNWPTWNPLDKNAAITLSEGNLFASSSTTDDGLRANFAIPQSGKWYWEVTPTVKPNNSMNIGIAKATASLTTDSIASEPITRLAGSNYNVNDVVSIAVDADSQSVVFRVNNSVVSATSTTTFNAGDIFFPYANMFTSSAMTIKINFGQLGFTYTPPSGFEALNTSNLPDPSIDPNDDETPDQYFDSQLYTGNGGTQEISSFSFQPDWVWIKNRVNADDHYLFDSVRGATKTIHSNGPTANSPALAEFTSANALQTFDSDGFTTGGDGGTNRDEQTYVAWAWKAGTSQSFSGESGTLDSTVSSSSEAGFSIVKYTGGSDERVKHGMGTNNIPEMILVKSLSDTSNWAVYHANLSLNNFVELSTNGATQSGSNPRFLSSTYSTSVPTDTYFFIRNYSGSTTNNSSSNYIAYCFLSVDGYSKMGAWTNNGSTDGTFIFTGFRPAFILLKNFDSTEGWYIIDNRRSPLNIGPPLGQFLGPNLNNIEGNVNASTATIDLVSNGFKIRTTNAGAGEVSFGTRQYIYMAFADQPLKYSNAR